MYQNLITPYNVNFPSEIIFGNEDVLTLTGIREAKDFTTKKFIGYYFHGITEDMKHTMVKVLYDAPIDLEQFHLNSNLTVKVKFSNVTTKVYIDNNNRLAFSVKAEKVEVL